MILYPAIDLRDGRAVRLRQGSADEATDYGDPLAAAEAWQAGGARWIHLVDLDGAFTGESQNLQAVARIRSKVGCHIQLGGGIRTLEQIAHRLETLGVDRVILGTAALEDPALVAAACARYPGRIACGIDAREGKVAVRGWTAQSQTDALDLALSMGQAGVTTLIYTDIARDGMLSGPNLSQTRRLVEQTGMGVIASGGISELSDLQAVQAIGCSGVIVGKALYSGHFTLAEALAIV